MFSGLLSRTVRSLVIAANKNAHRPKALVLSVVRSTTSSIYIPYDVPFGTVHSRVLYMYSYTVPYCIYCTYYTVLYCTVLLYEINLALTV
jgi:hypothetical protein